MFFFVSAFIYCQPLGNVCTENYEDASFDLNIDCYISRMCACYDENTQIKALFEFTPYLYPFSIEFNILVGKMIRSDN